MENNQELIICSFCKKNVTKIKKIISSNNVFICDECVETCYKLIKGENLSEASDDKINISPNKIKSILDEYVIGQENAKILMSVAVSNHYKRIYHNEKNENKIEKSNILIVGPSGSGKAQPLYSKILTKNGWKKLEHIKENDLIINNDNKIVKIKKIHPQGKKKIFLFIFEDNRKAYSCEDHLWKVLLVDKNKLEKKTIFLTTKEIVFNKIFEHKSYDILFPIPKPLGKIKNSEENFILDDIEKIIKNKENIDDYILNLSINHRIKIIKKYKKIYYENNNKKIFSNKKENKEIIIHLDDIREEFVEFIKKVIWSLGGKINYIEIINKAYILCVFPFDIDIKYLNKKKLENLEELYIKLNFFDVVDEYDCACIEIDDQNKLYVTDDFVVTHNTYMLKTIANYLKVPFCVIDSTTLTETGYVGDDVSVILQRLLLESNGDVKMAEKGIVFIDEIDKKARKVDSSSIIKDVSGEGVQQSLLKILEESKVKIPIGNFKKQPQQIEFVEINTKDILFILGGAFSGIEKIIENRLTKEKIKIGFNSYIKDNDISLNKDIIEQIESEDFIKYGMLKELIGRTPIVIPFKELTRDQLYEILIKPKNSIIYQYKNLFRLYGIDIDFTKESLYSIVDIALQKDLGARGLRSIMEKKLSNIFFNVEIFKNQCVKKIIITEEYIKEEDFNHLKKIF